MSDRPLATPVAFFVFNRPDTTARVFEAIRRARPERLLIVADGPREGRTDDAASCRATRAVVEAVDWDCAVETDCAARNMGCRRRFASGLTWVFERCEEAIILEDDCVPAPSFFPFCQALLEHYRDDPRVFLVGGDNFLGPRSRRTDSYYFSKYIHTWGWATWRRSIELFDIDMKSWPAYKASGRLRSMCSTRAERRYWEARFDACYAGDPGVWDYQMLYACWLHERLTIVPERNLVSNIGFIETATHVTLHDSATHDLPVEDIWEIAHPARVEQDRAADDYLFRRVYHGRARRVLEHLKRGYDARGVRGLGHATVDLAQRTLRLLRAHRASQSG